MEVPLISLKMPCLCRLLHRLIKDIKLTTRTVRRTRHCLFLQYPIVLIKHLRVELFFHLRHCIILHSIHNSPSMFIMKPYSTFIALINEAFT